MKYFNQPLTYIFLCLISLNTSYVISRDSLRIQKLSPKFKNININPDIEHDKWITKPVDIVYNFAAYTSSFDSEDPTIEGEENISWGIPEWVAFEIQKKDSKPGCKRPSPWLTDLNLYEKRIAPNDDSYTVSGTKKMDIVSTDYRYIRGHMCPFATAARISCDAAWNTCTVLNAVPQLQWQNNGVWKQLETICTDWVDDHEEIWVICGPVFFERNPSIWLGQKAEVRTAVPDALFKIIIREADNETGVETIAFIIPNVVPKEKPLYEFVTNIEQIESLTGIHFLNALSKDQQLIEKSKHGIPPLPDNYDNMSNSERKRAREERKKAFHEANITLINSWLNYTTD